MGQQGTLACLVGIPVGIITLLVVILVPLSFSDLQYYEYGFLKRKSTGTVYMDKVYSGGRHFVGPDYHFKVFQADAHFEELTSIAVFSLDKLEIRVTCRFQYFLRKDDLPLLHETYDRFYHNVMKTSAIDALKSASPEFNTRDFFEERRLVEDTLADAVKLRLEGNCCKKDCANSTEDSDKVEKIENQAREISHNATAQSELITSRADAQAVAVVEEARNSGLSLIYERLDLTSADHKASFNYIRTLRDHESVHLSVNYDTLITGFTASGRG
ncbi:uncharacterized protein LOC118407678 [Branchiostoma floridae]|uniref:Uncharacterized protein LOC118407678 n=1 Tax=Branchiostoma floridae TaxID=7739 RepID=A0A9J7KBG4_BRAFL|nr:uncharacterized protein LOC118407678 [Branchiostoma floridae]